MLVKHLPPKVMRRRFAIGIVDIACRFEIQEYRIGFDVQMRAVFEIPGEIVEVKG